jgi:hypothetical protein
MQVYLSAVDATAETNDSATVQYAGGADVQVRRTRRALLCFLFRHAKHAPLSCSARVPPVGPRPPVQATALDLRVGRESRN